MRILIVTPHFCPENFKCNDMAFELVRRGNEVSVMTAIPDYPKGKFFDGYGVFRRRRETIKGVKIYRSLIIPRGSGSPLCLALNYISYTFFAIFMALWLGIRNKYDRIFVFQISPVMVGIPAVIIKKIQRIPLFFWVQDLWPESLSAAGGIHSDFILGFFSKLSGWLYKNSDKILISSKGFKKSICKKGNFEDKIIFFPNWIDDIDNSLVKYDAIPKLPTGFIVMFAGNMGDAQDLPAVLNATKRLKEHPDVHFVFIGDGRKKEWVDSYIKENDLSETVHCLGRFPREAMPAFFHKAAILLLSLKDTEIFALTVPSRMQAYMAAGKPVVAMLNGEGADVIAEADCGYSVPAGDSMALAELILFLRNVDSRELASKGAHGRLYSSLNYDFHKCMDELMSIMSSVK